MKPKRNEARAQLALLKQHVKGLPSVSLFSSEGRTPLYILVSTVLSARTRDQVTTNASRAVLEIEGKERSLDSLIAFDEADLARLIYPVAFFTQKARALRELFARLRDEFDGEVPQSFEELTSLPGVGPKTAALVQGLAFGIPAVCVDVHVDRISKRLNWVGEGSVDDTRKELESLFPKEDWISINTILVEHGKQTCKPRVPNCPECPLGGLPEGPTAVPLCPSRRA